MNCHRARQLISPYLDQRLTGREMLVLQKHFAECASCDAECRSIRQVRMMLRALHEPRPRTDLPDAIAGRLSQAEQPLWRVVTLPPARPQRGRRLATALALSCLTVLSFAASLAPASRDGSFTSSAFLLTDGVSPLRSSSMGDTGLVPMNAPQNGFQLAADADALRRERFLAGQYAAPTPPDLRLGPLPETASPEYVQNASTFAIYRTH